LEAIKPQATKKQQLRKAAQALGAITTTNTKTKKNKKMKSWAKAKLSQSAYAEGGVYPNWFAGAFYVYFVYFC